MAKKAISLETTIVPSIRVRRLNDFGFRPSGTFVLYWMTAFRRLEHNFALQRAVEHANSFGRPLLILEALRCHYRWACDRFHQFVLDGMVANSQKAAASQASYCAYVEPQIHHASGLMESLAKDACAIVTDDYPCFFHPVLTNRIASRWECAVEAVDSNTIIPMRQADRTFTVAHSYRRAMQKVIYAGLPDFPEVSPLERLCTERLTSLPARYKSQWGLSLSTSPKDLSRINLKKIEIDHSVEPVRPGGAIEAHKTLDRFIQSRIASYSSDRNEPEMEGSSGLAPYLHFGHISPHEIFLAIAKTSQWTLDKLSKPNGKMDGYWNMGPNAEAFMDQLMTWREIGFNMCCRERNFDRYESLPSWAIQTLDEHRNDPRQFLYSLEEFESAQTHDPLWNAAQRQLVREGRIHNYLRMLWGKKILNWSKSPEDALHTMVQLNNKYALDGRDPNSYSGIFWVLGRYDRAWGPERPIFGKVRYMTSESTQNKYSVKQYIQKYSAEP
jgi:deoxyribodipyrimidine photo-lyase